jgi:hypothetical protein
MVTEGVDVQGIAMLTYTFGHAEIENIGTVFMRTFKIIINVHVQFFFVLLRGGFNLDVTVMRRGYNFLADSALLFSAAGISFE